MRTVKFARETFTLPTSTRARLRLAPVRAILWAVVFTLFIVAVLIGR